MQTHRILSIIIKKIVTLLNIVLLGTMIFTFLNLYILSQESIAQTKTSQSTQEKKSNKQETGGKTTPWIKNCVRENDEKLLCITSQNFFLENGQQLIAIAIRSSSDSDKKNLIAKVPIGIKIKPGIELKIGDDIVKLEYDICVNDGCQADKKVSESVIQKMFSQDNVQVLYILYNGQRVRVGMPLQSFQKVYEGEPQSVRNKVKVKKN